MKAIETVYKGFKFRSRQEARWAVFFDALQVNWDYEPEGFDLGEIWYLPDFHLLDIAPRTWVEIKKELPTDADEFNKILEKAIGLSQHKKENVVVLFGNPYPGEYHMFFIGYSGDTDTLVIPNYREHPEIRVVFGESHCGAISIAVLDTNEGEVPVSIRIRNATKPCPNPSNCRMWLFTGVNEMSQKSPDLWAALMKARQARFEHGQSG
ncbi:MAG TPA: hypothetical protein VGB07_00550 [Blastocatellia bacterium]